MCLGKLAHITGFRDYVFESDGIGLLTFEVMNRRSTAKSYLYKYRHYKNTIEDECSDRIYSAIRRDVFAIKIQSLLRRRMGLLRARKAKRRAFK